ncbi:MAG TPA: RNA polymerase sigma factor [Sphingobacteriaceae bacterium]|nr:RNA polymerase sigma factor [Sphingobacteriaceae bacterium]
MNRPFGYARKETVFSLRGAIDACVKKQDSKAKEYIYKRYYGYLMAVILRYIKDPQDAEELVNESFKSESDGESLEKMFLGWMARVSANLSIDHLRAKKQLTLIDDHSEFEVYVRPTAASDNLEVADILKLLDELPEIQRFIFNLFEVDGYSHEEIALQLDIPESTSRTYLARAKKKLRTLYQTLHDN